MKLCRKLDSEHVGFVDITYFVVRIFFFFKSTDVSNTISCQHLHQLKRIHYSILIFYPIAAVIAELVDFREVHFQEARQMIKPVPLSSEPLEYNCITESTSCQERKMSA